MEWPNNKDFAFTIIDDTDAGTVANSKPVYDLLLDKGILTTKTVWAYPSRDGFTGESLSDEHYARFVEELVHQGVELASHGPGSGDFTRDEILRSFQRMEELAGYHPRIFINHANNKSNIYWADKRFGRPISTVFRWIKKIRGEHIATSYGDVPGSPFYWGDYAKEKIAYMRNHVFTRLDTLSCDKVTPYRDRAKNPCSNEWFSSSDGYDCLAFNRLLETKQVDALIRGRGCAIVYTHFGYGFVKDGQLDETFVDRIEYLAEKNGWFVPASQLLDHLKLQKAKDPELSATEKWSLDFKWFWQRTLRKIFWRV